MSNYFFTRLIVSFFLVANLASLIYGQEINATNNWQTNLVTKISNTGYQNIAINLTEHYLAVYYENRVQRFEPRAIIEIIHLIGQADLPDAIDTIHLTTQKLQLPLITTHFTISKYKKWKTGEISLPEFVKSIVVAQGGKRLSQKQETPITNSGNYRFEVEIKPQIGLGLGGFPDPVIHRFYLLPTLNTYLWKGALLKTEVILPISSEFQLPDEHFIRPGILSLTQTLQLPKKVWLQASVGYFTKNRYGGRLSLSRFWFNGALAATGHIGYTGYASYPLKFGLEQAEKGWEYADINYLDYNIGLNYWFQQWNTQIRLEYGKALFNKEQLKFTCLQRFNEVDIGFFALKTQRGNNYGMQLNIPILPKKYWKPKRLSIRPSRHLNYTYQAKQATVEEYFTGNTILGLYRHLNPAFIKNQLFLPKNWILN